MLSNLLSHDALPWAIPSRVQSGLGRGSLWLSHGILLIVLSVSRDHIYEFWSVQVADKCWASMAAGS